MACKVLVADDEVCITSVVARKLTNAGLDVVVAADGLEAYEKAIAERRTSSSPISTCQA